MNLIGAYSILSPYQIPARRRPPLFAHESGDSVALALNLLLTPITSKVLGEPK